MTNVVSKNSVIIVSVVSVELHILCNDVVAAPIIDPRRNSNIFIVKMFAVVADFVIDLFVFILAISGKVKLRLLFLKKALHIEVGDNLFACLLFKGFTSHTSYRSTP